MAKTVFEIKRLKEELNSETFLSGLEVVIEFTRRTGKEAGFNVFYSKEADILVYPDYIHLGDKYSISYRKDFDLPIDAPLCLRERMKKFCVKKNRMNRYPQSSDYKIRKEKGRSTREVASLISVHVHSQEYNLFPSGNDLRALNAARIMSVEYDKQNYQARNPVSIIVTPIKAKCFHPLLIFQEKTVALLPKDTDFEDLSDDLADILADPLMSIFGKAFHGGNYYGKYYNIQIANFYLTNRRIVILEGDKFLPLVR